MKAPLVQTTLRIAVVGLALVAAGAFAGGGDQALVGSAAKPHASISAALPPGPNYYRAKIVWIDGKYLSNPQRDTFWVTPGRHTIGFRAIINSERGPIVMSNPANSAPRNMATLTLDLEQGYTYYFAARIPETGNPSQWKPVMIKKEKSD